MTVQPDRFPSFVSTRSDVADPHFVQVWRNADGEPRAQVALGGAEIFFRSSADADAVIAAVTEARDALAALEAEGPQPGQQGDPQ